jgi:hypothetical protein
MTLSPTPVLRCHTSICFARLFSISNSTLLFEQSSHLLSRVGKPNLLTFCWLFCFCFFLLTSFVERMSSCCLFPFCFCLLALVRFYFFAHSTTPAWLKHHVFFFSFHYFSITFFMWISTRICCVEHVNDCTPIRR